MVENFKQPRPLVPGTFVHARISGERLERAIVIPRDAIAVDKRGRQFVWVVTTTDMESEPATEARTIERRILVDGQEGKMKTLQTLALVDEGVLKDGELIVLTNLDALSDGSLIQVSRHEDVRTLDTELAIQPVSVLRRIGSPTDAAKVGRDIK